MIEVEVSRRRWVGRRTRVLLAAAVVLVSRAGGGCSGKQDAPVDEEMEGAGTQAGETAVGWPPLPDPPDHSTAPADPDNAVKVEGIVEGIAPEEDPPLYGRALWNVVTIYEKPDMRSLHMGYMRKGQVVVIDEEKVKDRTPKAPSCRKGWWRLSHTGGYICSSKGVEAGRELLPSNFYPVPPATDQPMPYSYGHVMSDLTPLYERLPSEAEEQQVEEWIQEKKKELEAKQLAKEQALLDKAKKEAEAKAAAEAALEKAAAEVNDGAADDTSEPAPAPAPDDAASGSTPAEKAAPEAEAATPTPAPDDAASGSPAATEPVAVEQEEEPPDEAAEKDKKDIPFDYLRMLMFKGFYVSIDREVIHGGVKWWRTIKGLYVKQSKLLPVKIRIRGGSVLDESFDYPAGIVLRETIFERVWNTKHNHIKKNKDVVYDKFFVFRIHGKQIDKVNDIDAVFYEITPDGSRMVLSWSIVPMMKPEPPPPEVDEGGKWIHVDVSSQTLTAYQGERPVFMTLVSTGNEKEDEEYATVRGTFTVQSKHLSTTMDNLAMDEGAYSIEDVPWTMYFHSSYATHGAFWHSMFGHQRSHGCVNMTPKDAKWLFEWADPKLPAGWHGVVSSKDRPGTVVKVTD